LWIISAAVAAPGPKKFLWLIDHQADLVDVPRKGVGEPRPPGSAEFQNAIRRIDEGAVEVILTLRIHGIEALALHVLDGFVGYEQGVDDPESNMDPAFIEDDRVGDRNDRGGDRGAAALELRPEENRPNAPILSGRNACTRRLRT
jgi:hypothetical protein